MSAGSRADFFVGVNGTYLTYQWWANGGSVGTSSPTYVTAPLTANTTVTASVYSGSAGRDTAAATAHVCNGPTVYTPTVNANGSCKWLQVAVEGRSARTSGIAGLSGTRSSRS